jgi:hypothetical protein
MGFVVKPKCLSCNREWPNVTIGDARHFVCICRHCNNIVNPERVGFRRQLRPCPLCGTSLAANDIIDMLNTPIDYAGNAPSGLKCPKCTDGNIAFATVMHFMPRLIDSAPVANELVHGTIRNGKLDVPGMFLFHTIPTLIGAPDASESRLMELKTSKVVRHEESVDIIEFEFIRYVE